MTYIRLLLRLKANFQSYFTADERYVIGWRAPVQIANPMLFICSSYFTKVTSYFVLQGMWMCDRACECMFLCVCVHMNITAHHLMLEWIFADWTGLFIGKLIVPIVPLPHSSLPDSYLLQKCFGGGHNFNRHFYDSDGFYFKRKNICTAFYDACLR